MKRLLVLFTIVVALSGCASGGLIGGGASPFGDISKLAVDDIQAALADATAHNDKPAMQCYPVLLEVVKSLPSQTPSEPKGIVSAFQQARDLAKAIQAQTAAGEGSIVQVVNLGCAALFNDAQGDILRLAKKIRP